MKIYDDETKFENGERNSRIAPHAFIIKEMILTRAGFTLIELTVVVAIVGVLAALAIPNYEAYQAKSRRAEAKVALASVYSLEKAFYSEYTAYIPAMAPAFGYAAEGFRRFYYVGWVGSAYADAITHYNGGFTPIAVTSLNKPAGWTGCSPPSALTDASGRSTHIGPGFPTDNPQRFLVAASGEIRRGGGCDDWSIDELKQLRHVRDGI